MLNGSVNKLLVALSAALSTGLTSYYGTAQWIPVVTSVVGALLVYLVPNVPAPKPVPAPPPIKPASTP